MLSSLMDVGFDLLEQGYKIGLDGLGQFARAIIEGIGIIGVGIIVFALVLKAITMPFDIYQRVKMRKQNLLMQQMKPELEKLQQQYANDKTMYQQKMTELYKKNGYNMLAACLPMIISLVILIVAFQGFRGYSQYANLSMYENMSVQYNAAILEHGVNGLDYHLQKEGAEADELTIVFEENKTWEEDGVRYTMYLEHTTEPELDGEGNAVVDGEGNTVMKPVSHRFMRVQSTDEQHFLYYVYSLETNSIRRQHQIALDKLYDSAEESYRTTLQDIQKQVNEDSSIPPAQKEQVIAERTASAAINYVAGIGAQAAAEWYRDGNDSGFLWVKNVWYPDVSYNHPIQSYSSLKSQLNTRVTLQSGEKVPLSSVLNETQYNNLTSALTEEKGEANGYFILIILSIGLMVLSQFISMRSSKETNKYQSVDGRGGRTQKVMLVMMPLIYAVFAFMYSAAFSIYMTMSSLISLLSTVIINLILGSIYKKKEHEQIVAQYERVLPWQKKQQEEAGKKGKNKNKRKK